MISSIIHSLERLLHLVELVVPYMVHLDSLTPHLFCLGYYTVILCWYWYHQGPHFSCFLPFYIGVPIDGTVCILLHHVILSQIFCKTVMLLTCFNIDAIKGLLFISTLHLFTQSESYALLMAFIWGSMLMRLTQCIFVLVPIAFSLSWLLKHPLLSIHAKDKLLF